MSINPASGLRCLGTNGDIAKKFHVTREAVRQWMAGGIPADRALEAEEVTQGKISALDVLRFAKKKRIKNGLRRAA